MATESIDSADTKLETEKAVEMAPQADLELASKVTVMNEEKKASRASPLFKLDVPVSTESNNDPVVQVPNSTQVDSKDTVSSNSKTSHVDLKSKTGKIHTVPNNIMIKE